MSAASHRRLSVAEYLAIERSSDLKHEFIDGEVFAMAGASRQHNEIKQNPRMSFAGDSRGPSQPRAGASGVNCF